MKFQVSDGEKYQKVMEAEIPAEEMEMPIKFACKRLANKVNIPGFRKGKAPRAILENFVGMQAILEEAADELLSQAYVTGLEETGLEPVARPDAEVVTLAEDKPCVFKYTITVRPEVKLGQYKGLEVKRQIVEINDTDIDKDLDKQRERLTRLVVSEPDTVAENGHILNIDFIGYQDGVPFKGGEAVGYPLELGSQSFIPGFEEQLVGCKAGDVKDVEVTFPENYQAEELAGKPATFHVTVKEIRTRQIPPLDDVFVQQVSETAENLDQLREEIRTRLNEDSMRIANQNARNNAVVAAIETLDVDLPPVMVEQEIDDMLENQSQQLQSQGLTMEQFLQYTGSTMESVREDFRNQAEMFVKRDLLLEEIARAEELQATEEEQEEELKEMSRTYLQPLEKIRAIMSQDNRMRTIVDSIRRRKAEDVIFENAVLTDEVIDRDKVMAEAAAAEAATAEAEEAADAAEEAPAEGIVEAEAEKTEE